MIARPVAAVVAALLSVTLSAGRASALSQDVGKISCDAISGYGATSPAYFEVFQAYLEGYLAGEKSASNPGRDERDATTLMTAVIEYCKISRDASFATAVAAVAKQ